MEREKHTQLLWQIYIEPRAQVSVIRTPETVMLYITKNFHTHKHKFEGNLISNCIHIISNSSFILFLFKEKKSIDFTTLFSLEGTFSLRVETRLKKLSKYRMTASSTPATHALTPTCVAAITHADSRRAEVATAADW